MEYIKVNTLRGQVEYCLEKFPESRDDDTRLLAEVLANFYPFPDKMLENWYEVAHMIKIAPSLDEIAKKRRDAIEGKIYKKWLPNSYLVAERRGIDKAIYKKYARKNNLPTNKEELDKLIQANSLYMASNIPEGYDRDGNIESSINPRY